MLSSLVLIAPAMEAKKNNMEHAASPLPAAASPDAVTMVLGNDDILREILLRVGFPSTLVRRRWLRHASDRAFLLRFRDRHPPRLLGFYIKEYRLRRQRFVPVSRAPELAAAVRLAADAVVCFDIYESRNGRLVGYEFGETGRFVLLDPLRRPARGTVCPSLPPPTEHTRFWFFLADDDGGAAVGMFSIGAKLQVDLLALRSGAWVVHRTALLDHPETLPLITGMLPPARGKIYMLSHPHDTSVLPSVLTFPARIIRLDMDPADVSVIQFPDTVRTTNFKLSGGEQDSCGLGLVYAEANRISVWRLATNNGGTNEWVLVYDRIQVPDRLEHVRVMAVDDTCEFVFLGLQASGVVICMHLKSRTEKVEKIWDPTMPAYMSCLNVSPFKMLWPPTFPAIPREGTNQEE